MDFGFVDVVVYDVVVVVVVCFVGYYGFEL